MTIRVRPLGLAALAVTVLLLGAGGPAAALSLEEVLNLELSGVSEETILKLVDVERAVFHLGAYDIVRLKEAGASEDFIRELMDTPERYGRGAQAAPDVDVDVHVYGDDGLYDDDFEWTDDYYALEPDDYATVFVYKYYDPFAYYWYPWPSYYVYYSPFWWSRAGFYFAGHWCWDWWDPWGPSSGYCDWHWGYSHHYGPSHTRPVAGRSWQRARSAAQLRAGREETILHRAGLTAPGNIRQEARVRVADRRTVVSPARGAGEVREARSARTVERPAYRRTEDTRPTRGATRGEVRRPAEERRSSTSPTYRRPGSRDESASPGRTPQVRPERPQRGTRSTPAPRPQAAERSPERGNADGSSTPSPDRSSGGDRSGSGSGGSRRR